MFSGIVEERGTVLQSGPGRLVVGSTLVSSDAELGSSIAVNGVCLTVVASDGTSLAFDVTPETLERTDLGDLRPDDPVNLERPLTLTTRLGGHLVQGHVDGVAELVKIEPSHTGAVMTLRAPTELSAYIVQKGSVTIDGISLTVASRDGSEFSIALIPHTMEVTTLGQAKAGDRMNLEVDVIARYVESLLKNGAIS